MQIIKQSFGYVLETGVVVIVFDMACIDRVKIPDIHLYNWKTELIATIPNQHIKEFEKSFIQAGGAIE